MQVTSPKCPNCGAAILDPNAKFCAHCGSAIVVSNAPQPQPTVASLLEFGKSLLATGNFKDADKQFIHVLQIEPDNKEAWLWRGVCANPSENAMCWEKAGFSRDQVVNSLASVVDGEALLSQYYIKYFYGYPRISGCENQATIYLDAVLRAQHGRPSREKLLGECFLEITGLAKALRYKYKDEILDYCIGLQLSLDRLGPDQPGDFIECKVIPSRDIFGDSFRTIREKPSYWRKYVQQTIAKYSK
jgi:hypothetical protein